MTVSEQVVVALAIVLIGLVTLCVAAYFLGWLEVLWANREIERRSRAQIDQPSPAPPRGRHRPG